ncbi:MAG: NUDIX domain-containing protein [Bacteroidetes bacterium]|nr:NUDIX domain-containing protein [Bacteroidota bacterium]
MFNVRVYGIFINQHQQLLLSDEMIRGKFYTKFPGGGLEKGEGTRECLIREFKEELNAEIKVESHFYTTDFYQQSAFNADDQIISIYYKVTLISDISHQLQHPHHNNLKGESSYSVADYESFRLVDLKELTAESVSLPIDKVVVSLLLKEKN